MPAAPRSVPAREDDPPSRAALVDAALRLFVRDGIEGTSIRAVAAEAGYSNPALFKFYAGKDALALDVFARAYDGLAASLAAAVAGEAPFDEKLRALVAAAVGFLDADLDAFLFVHDHLRAFWPRLAASGRHRSIVRLLEALIEAGAAEGRVARDHDRRLLVAAVIGILGQFARALYFDELPRPARRSAGELERLLKRVLW